MSPAAVLTFAQLVELYTRHGFDDPVTAAAVATAESGGNPSAALIVTPEQAAQYNATHPMGPRHGPERSFGLHQINALVWTRFDETRLLDPDYNAEAAKLISRGGSHWQPWSTYTSGLYRRFMPDVHERPTLPDIAGIQASQDEAVSEGEDEDQGPDGAA